MTRTQRTKAEDALRRLWDKRSVPHMPVNEVRRLTDRDLGYLLRFWSHKDKWWDVEDAPSFTEEPPQGYEAMRKTEAERKAFVDDMGPNGLSAKATDYYADLCDQAYDFEKDREAMGY